MKAWHLLLENCNKELRQDPENWDLIKIKGILNNLTEQHDKAIADLNRIINEFPDYISAYYVRSHSYFSTEQYSLAKQDYLTAMKAEDKNDKSDIKSAKKWASKAIATTEFNYEEEAETMRIVLDYERVAALINLLHPYI